ncbi:DUF4105 domain-containing protein [Lysobacter cavernae]|uniref:DUF4105 domain-containing protein n=1 Tax=Lysobacter cavernae TaxID=1685901 RepID=A0ABV7RU35_9GAMM
MSLGCGRRWRWAVFGLVLCVGQAHAALRWRLDERGLTPAEIQGSRQLLDQAQARLPPAFAAALTGDIAVRWSDTLTESVHGHAGHDELLLNRRLLPALTDDRPVDRDDPRSAREQLLATVLHELAHFYDRAAPEGPLSRDPRLLDLAGWQVRATRLATSVAGRQRDNRFVDRSPDRYELTDPEEFVAVNLEYFLLDPEYTCRRPALQRYFAARLGGAPLPPAACTDDLVYVDAGGEGDALTVLDPARVYQVDYLLAEGNEQPMSRWGHSMLRLVVCAPGRSRGPDCRLDLAHHRVLSFRAFVDDVQLSSWRGLTGRYPSRLFVLPLMQVVEEYTKVELRGLQSLPLRLSEAEIAGLLQRAAQLHWSYDGRYYFLSNNCAVETFKLLHDGVPRLAGASLGSITPTGLLRRLAQADVADTTVLDDPAEALRVGYRFDSLRERFQGMFAVARARLDLPQQRVEDWMALPPAARRPWLERADLRASAALLLLEQAALRRQQLQVQDALKRRYLGRSAQELPADARKTGEAVQRLLRDSGYLGRPAELLDGPGYGLPQQQERQQLAVRSRLRQVQLQQAKTALWDEAKRLLDSDQRVTLDGIQVNSALLGQRLRTLHQAEGGLSLP